MKEPTDSDGLDPDVRVEAHVYRIYEDAKSRQPNLIDWSNTKVQKTLRNMIREGIIVNLKRIMYDA
jgi:hypothetical protein